ncbi:MAG: phage tail protein [Desulfatitalea sp.]|nr:phage tail protein [Desulfatitalea sp.]NNJ99336.1 phage tail protein [Desulfatitalea sp.]
MEEELVKMIKALAERRFGKYRGTVKRNDDPAKLGRLGVVVPSLFGPEETTWALPSLPFGGLKRQGMFFVPEVGARVWVEFEEGDVSRPIWTGVFWSDEADLPEEAAKSSPTTRILQTPSGHKLQFDDQEGERRIRLTHAGNSELVITDDGSVNLTNNAGMTLNLDQEQGEVLLEDAKGNMVRMNDRGWSAEDLSGNRIEMTDGSVSVSGASSITVDAPSVSLGGFSGEPLLKGLSFLTKYMAHTHTVAPIVGGPTSPPMPQGEMDALSRKVVTS